MLDILLHQSGHIMLSDFDLSKQSGEPGGAPATIKSGGPNGVCLSVAQKVVVLISIQCW